MHPDVVDEILVCQVEATKPTLSCSKKTSRQLFLERWRKKEAAMDPSAVPPSKKKNCQKDRLPKLTKLLEMGDFDTIIRMLKDESLTKQDLAPWFVKRYSMFGETCLHHVMQHRPPVELVQLMMDRFRNDFGVAYPQASLDAIRRTPLHIAVGFLCDPEIIKILAEGDIGKEIARSMDHQGRVPLHVAMRKYAMCAADKSLKSKKNKIIPQAPDLDDDDVHTIMTATTSTLLSVDPEVTLAIDHEHCTPINYAEEMSKCKSDDAMMDSVGHSITQGLIEAAAMAESQRSSRDTHDEGTVELDGDFTFEFEEGVWLHHLGKTVATSELDSKSTISGLHQSFGEGHSEDNTDT